MIISKADNDSRYTIMDLFRDFFLGFIKIHILHHAAQEPIYGMAMMQELQRHGYQLSPGTLYPILHQLNAQGYLAVSEQTVAGKGRKYYIITAEGRRALQEVQRKIRELGDEVVLGKGPSSLYASNDKMEKPSDES